MMITVPSRPPWAARLPFFYGWVIVAVAFVTMGLGVSVRTAFSLLYPPILAEFGWGRGETAVAFSLGSFASVLVSPVLGVVMDRYGPRRVFPLGALLIAAGLSLGTFITKPWHLYLTLGVLVGCTSNVVTYLGHSMFLPNWFQRRRGLAVGIAFSGVGVVSILLFPAVQTVIGNAGWRQACWTMAALLIVLVLPLNLLWTRQRPEEMGLHPDGDVNIVPVQAGQGPRAPVATEADLSAVWTLSRAIKSAPFWWICGAYVCTFSAWYMIQVHQTKYLLEIGISAQSAAVALGLAPLCGIAGQIGLGYLSDRAGREWAWTLSALGFAACYALLFQMRANPSPYLMYTMVASQGLLGFGSAAVFGAIPAEIFRGPSFGTILGVLSISSSLGSGGGPWIAGLSQDIFGSYYPAFGLGLVLSFASIVCIWFAAPRKGPVRPVRGKVSEAFSS